MKVKTRYECQSCGYQTPKWMGKCPDCNAWNTFSEQTYSKAQDTRAQQGFITLTSSEPVNLDDIELGQTPRFTTSIDELDRVLGGGIVPGSLVLLGGDPGIGKSTLVLESLDRLALQNVSVLYVTGEESKEQLKMRAERLGVKSNFTVVAENSLDRIIEHVKKIQPQVLVVDSIQTVYLPHLKTAHLDFSLHPNQSLSFRKHRFHSLNRNDF